MKITDLQTIIMTMLAFLLSLLPMYNISAQTSTDAKQKQIRVKMFKNINGEVQVMDTVVNLVDHAEVLSSLKGLRADTALLRKMNSNLNKVYKLDSMIYITKLKDTIFNSKAVKLDTVRFQRLHGDQIKVYRLDTTLNAADREKMYKSLKAFRTDTAAFRMLKNRAIYRMSTDSTNHRMFKRQIFSEDGDTIRFEAMVPSKAFRLATDSAAFISIEKDGKWIRSALPVTGYNLNPAGFKEISITKNGNHVIHLDSLVAAKVANHKLKFLKDGKTGESRIYVIANDGKEHEITTERLELTTGDKTLIIMLKADVKEISAEEKAKLKDAGNRIEENKGETLKIDDVSFYPNPNDGRFSLNFSLDTEEDAAIRIMNSAGKTMYTEIVEASTGFYNKQIDLAGIAKGIYYLQIVQGDRYATRKVLVQ